MADQSKFFCSNLSRDASEQTFGTASIGNVWLLLEYPLAWERKAVEDSALSSTVKSFLSSVIKTLPRARVLLIKTDRLHTTGITFYVVRSREHSPFTVRFQLTDYDQLTELDIPSIAAGKVSAGGEVVNEPMFLVCTHGRRDKCCAKFGYPLYKALHATTKEPVWQSSHVGGDRFAANLVCLPHGLFYAHVTERAGQHIVEEYREGRIVLDKYRGRACYSHPVQAAEFFIRCETGILGVDELRYVGTEKTDDKGWRIRFEHAKTDTTYEADVKTRLSDFQNYITCDAVEEKDVHQFVLDQLRVECKVG
jgi:hypothetical protein